MAVVTVGAMACGAASCAASPGDDPMGAGGWQGTGGSLGAGGTPGTGASTGTCPDGWTPAWSDEFDGPADSAVDSSKWNYDFGPNWYNGELQYYSKGTDNAKLDGSGNLVIEARQEAREGKQYTSARLKTQSRKTFTYGRFEGRMKLPYGQGMWPAFWLLGAQGSWPACGEIDIMENLGREPSIAHGAMHGPGYSGGAGPTGSYTLPDGAKFSDDFHTFAIEWEADAIRWYVDGNLYLTKTSADIGGNTWVFNRPFFFILNVAVGGEWPGNPDSTTVFPQRMVVDYVRVCQR
jgi:beta-glucanase (GH16 family)